MKKILLTATLLSSFTMTSINAEDFSKDQINKMVKEYIQNNPETILDSIESYGRVQKEEQVAKQQNVIKDNLGWMVDNDQLPVAGNPDGDVTIIEFFDYNCGYCKKALDDVLTIIEEDKKIRFILIDTPILGRTSEVAARWSLAAKNQDAYLEYHIGLMKHRGPLSEMSLETVAKKVGLDIQKLREDANSDEIAKLVKEKAKKVAEIGITGTPAFIIDGKLYGGYIGLDMMRDAVQTAREEAKE